MHTQTLFTIKFESSYKANIFGQNSKLNYAIKVHILKDMPLNMKIILLKVI